MRQAEKKRSARAMRIVASDNVPGGTPDDSQLHGHSLALNTYGIADPGYNGHPPNPHFYWLLEIVSLDEPHPSRVVLPAHNGGVVAGRKSLNESGLQIVGWWNGRGLNLGLLAAAIGARLPVVVGGNQRPAAVPQLQGRIAQGVCDRNRWPQRPHDDSGGIAAASSTNNEPADQDIIAGIHKPARADVRRLGVRALPQIVNLDQPHAGSSVLARKDGRCRPPD